MATEQSSEQHIRTNNGLSSTDVRKHKPLNATQMSKSHYTAAANLFKEKQSRKEGVKHISHT